MSTTPRLPTGWLRFWFTPADPTPLGFIRIATGLLAVYVHLAYCFDLQAFFGKDGWYGLNSINKERREWPSQVPPFWGQAAWDETVYGAHVPEYPHRKDAVMKYLRSVPATTGELNTQVQYLDRLQELQNDVLARDGLAYLLLLPADDQLRKERLAGLLVKEELRKPGQPIPQFVSQMSLEGPGRPAVRDAVEAYWKSLPADDRDRTYVLNHLVEMDPKQRGEFLDFLRQVAGAAPADRERLLDYMDYWNAEERFAFRVGTPIFSLWFHVTGPAEMAAAHAVILVIMVLFAVGFCTRVTSVLTWLAAVSYIHRNQQVLFGMDTMMNILLLYLMVGNSGAALSADRLIARYRASRNSLRRTGAIDEPTRRFLQQPPPSMSAGFALRLLQVHFCFIYAASGLAKLKGPAWWSTMAYWDTLVNPEFTLIHYHWYEKLVRGLTAERPFYAVAAAGGVGFTFLCEIGLPFLVWTRMRPYWVMMGLALHAGIAIFMGLWIFSLLMMVMLVGYLPGVAIRDRLFGAASGPKVVVRFNRRSAGQERAAALIRAADFDDRVSFADGPAFAVEAGGKTSTGPAAAAEVLRHLPWFGPVAWARRVPGVGGVVTRLLSGGAESEAAPAGRAKVPVGR